MKNVKNHLWAIVPDEMGEYHVDIATLAVLMDIRNELQRLNALLRCRSFTDIPTVLRAIKSNTAKPKAKGKKP